MPVLEAIHSQLPPWASAHLEAAVSNSSSHMDHWRTYCVALVSLVLGYAIYKFFLRARFFSPLRHMPGPPYGHWLFGQMLTIVREEAAVPQMRWHREVSW